MLNIEYAPCEIDSDVLDCLEHRDHDSREPEEEINLGLSEDLRTGFRLGNGVRVLSLNAEQFLGVFEHPDRLIALKQEADAGAPLVLLIEGTVFAPASPLTYQQRSEALRSLMLDPDVHVLTLEDATDVAELILAFARQPKA